MKTSADVIGSRQIQMFQPRQPAQIRRLDRFIVIQIDQFRLVMAEHVAQTGRGCQVFQIAPMAGPFSDDDLGRSLAPAKLNDGRNDARIGVNHFVAMVLDQVRLQHDALAS